MTIRSMSKTLAQRSKYREVPGARPPSTRYVTRGYFDPQEGSIYSRFEEPSGLGEREIVYLTILGRTMWRYYSTAGSPMRAEWGAEAEGGVLSRFVLQEYPGVNEILLAETIRTTTCGEFSRIHEGVRTEHVLNRL